MAQNFNIIIKPTGARCNLACEYCYFLKKEKLYPGSEFRMEDETLKTFIQQYLDAVEAPEITFTWQGGEPTLMGIPFFKKVIEFQHKFNIGEKKINNNIQTNGILLDDDWGQFLAANNFLVGLSLDGPEHMHNQYRKTAGGKGTQTNVLHGLKILKNHNVETNILACISTANVEKPLDVYRYFRDNLDMRYIQFIPIVERINQSGNQQGYKLTSRSVTGEQYGDFLTIVFDEWIRKDVGRVFVQIFETCLGVWLGAKSSICIFQPTCGQCLVLEHNGDLYSCDHYVQPDALLGSIHEKTISDMVQSAQQKAFGMDKQESLPKACQRCEVLFICNGGCPKNRINRIKKGDHHINHLCQGYKTFFSHVQEPMRLMASLIQMQRQVTEVMKIYRADI
jgi:uncharacterized protein